MRNHNNRPAQSHRSPSVNVATTKRDRTPLRRRTTPAVSGVTSPSGATSTDLMWRAHDGHEAGRARRFQTAPRDAPTSNERWMRTRMALRERRVYARATTRAIVWMCQRGPRGLWPSTSSAEAISCRPPRNSRPRDDPAETTRYPPSAELERRHSSAAHAAFTATLAPQRLCAAGRRVDHRIHWVDRVHREAAALPVLADRCFVLGHVDAEDPVVRGDEALEPLGPAT